MKKLLKLLATITLTTTPILTTTACNFTNKSGDTKNNEKQTQYKIAVAINQATYSTIVDLQSPIAIIEKQITVDFIKSQLNSDLQTTFQPELLTIKDIMINNNPLSPQDLNQVGDNVQTILNFQYGDYPSQTKLILQVQDLHKQQVIKDINTTEFQYINDTSCSLQELKNDINPDFIKTQLNPETCKLFHSNNFQITNFMKSKTQLSTDDLKIAGTFFITVNFKYYEQASNFTLKLILNPTVTTQIITKITNSIYETTIETTSLTKDVQTKITPEFIQNNLLEPVKSKFKSSRFTIQQLINKSNNQILTNDDLLQITTLDISIEFTYDGIVSQTSLKLNVVANQDHKITSAITNTIYAKTISIGFKATQLQTDINGSFIQDKLINPFKAQFDVNKWTLLKLINTTTKLELTDNDLTNISNIDITIQFTYNNIQSQTSLQLNITSIHNNEMVTAISNLNIKFFNLTFEPAYAEQYFNAQFIKSQLSIDLQSKFKNSEYKFIKLDSHGFTNNPYELWTLHFSYQGKIGVTSIFLAIDTFQRFIFANNEPLTITVNSTVDQLKTKFWNDLKTFVIGKTPTPKQETQYQFVLANFNIQIFGIIANQAGVMGQAITDDDLKIPGNVSIFLALTIDSSFSVLPKTVTIDK